MGYDGSINIDSKIDNKKFNKSINSMSSSIKKIGLALGAAFSVKKAFDFVKDGVSAASELSNAWTGLNSILEGQGKSFNKAKSFIEEYISDGLVSATEATTAYKNLSLRGYNTEQIEQVMKALKDSATFGRQASYGLGEAVATASEGLKNENSIVVDNAGVTKNVAKMWEEYAKSIGKATNQLTQAEKIQAEVKGIMDETYFQKGDAALYLNTYSGQLARLSASFTALKQSVGNAVIPVLQAILPYVNAVIQGLTKVAQTFAAVVQLIFGKTADTSKKLAKSTSKAASGISGMGDAAEKAGKQAKGALASFDDLEVLSSNTGSGSSGGAGGGSTGIEDIDLSGLDTSTSQLAVVSDEVQRIAESILNFFELLRNISFDNLVNAFKDLFEAIKPLTKTIFEGLYWAYENIFVPLTKWTIEDLLPAFIKLIAGAIKVLTPIVKGFMNVGKWLFEKFLKPIAKWTGGVIIAVLEGLAKCLTKLGNWMSKNQKTVDVMTGTVIAFFAAWKVTQILGFVQMSGGVVSALKKLAVAIGGVTAKKIKDKAETMYLTALYAKDFLTGIIKNIAQLGKEVSAWVASTAAKVANGVATGSLTVATIAHTVATKAAEAAQWLLNTAMNAMPLMLLVSGIAALTAGLFSFIGSQKKSNKAELDAIQAKTDKINAIREEYEAVKKSQEQFEQTAANNLVEINNAERLGAELKTLADEKGNVAEKDQTRVEFILSQLNPALDTEYKLVDGQIQKYDELNSSIDKIIQTKKAQILLEAKEAQYKEALINLTKAQMERDKAKEEMDAAFAEHDIVRYLDAKARYATLDATCKEYNQNIRDYEMATEDMQQQNYEQAINRLTGKAQNLTQYESLLDKSAEEQNRILKQQYEQSEKDLETYRRRYEQGLEGYTEDGLQAAINYRDQAQAEYQKVGQAITEGTIQGVNSKAGLATSAISALMQGVKNTAKNELEIHSPSKVFKNIGANTVQGYIDGANGKQNSMTSAMKRLFNSAINTAKRTLDSHSPSRVFKELGKNTDEGFIQGIESSSSAVDKCMNALMNGIVNTAQDTDDIFNTDNINTFASSIQNLVSVFTDLRNIVQYVKEDIADLINNKLSLNNNLMPLMATGTVTPYQQNITNNNNNIDNKLLKELIDLLKQKDTVKTDKVVMLQPIGNSGFARYVIKSINDEQESAGRTLLKI